MVKVCTMPSCKNKQTKKDQSYNHVQFHSFPVGRQQVLERWVEAVGRGEGWWPGPASRLCSAHFAADCFKATDGPRRLLHPDAVPTLHCPADTTTTPRGLIHQDAVTTLHCPADTTTTPHRLIHPDAVTTLDRPADTTTTPHGLLHPDAVPTLHCQASTTTPHPPPSTSTTGVRRTGGSSRLETARAEWRRKLQEVRRKNRVLRLRLGRRDARLKQLRRRLDECRVAAQRGARLATATDRLQGFMRELLEHSVRNCETKRTGMRYSGALREFALTLYLHSPRAYLYVRSLLRLLPNPSLIKKWIANFNRTPLPPPVGEQSGAACCLESQEMMVTESGELVATEELIIEDMDSFIVMEDGVTVETCMVHPEDPSLTIPVMVAHHVQIH